MSDLVRHKNFFRPVVSFLLNGDWGERALVEKLDWIRSTGFGGVMPIPAFSGRGREHERYFEFGVDRAGVEYLSEEFFRRYEFMIAECRKRELLIWLWDDVYCPAGWAGGRCVEAHEELLGRTLCQIPRQAEEEAAREGLRIIAVDDEFCYGEAMDPRGLRVDVLHPDAAKRFIDVNYRVYHQRLGGAFQHTVVGFFFDEPGCAGTLNARRYLRGRAVDGPIPWSTALERRFAERFGYEIIWKSLFHYAGGRECERCRNDFATLVTDGFDAYLGELSAWCRERDIRFFGHLNNDDSLHSALIGNGDLTRALRHFDYPGVDAIIRDLTPGKEEHPEVLMEWDSTSYNAQFFKFAAAARPDSRLVLAETGGSYGFGMSPGEVRWVFDYLMTQGITLFTHQNLGISNRGFAFQGGNLGEIDSLSGFYPDLLARTAAVCRLLAESAVTPAVLVYNPIRTLYRQDSPALNDAFEALLQFASAHGVAAGICGATGPVAATAAVLVVPVGTAPDRVEMEFLSAQARLRRVWVPEGLTIPGARVYQPGVLRCFHGSNGRFGDYAQALYADLTDKLPVDFPAAGFPELRFIVAGHPREGRLCYVLNTASERKFSTVLPSEQHIWEPESGVRRGLPERRLTLEPGEAVLLAEGAAAPPPPWEYLRMQTPLQRVAAARLSWDGEHFREIPAAGDEEVRSGWIEWRGEFDMPAAGAVRLVFTRLEYAAQIWIDDQVAGRVYASPLMLEIPAAAYAPGRHKLRIRVYGTAAAYIRSAEFARLAETYCTPEDLAINALRNPGAGWQNRYTAMTAAQDGLRSRLSFELHERCQPIV